MGASASICGANQDVIPKEVEILLSETAIPKNLEQSPLVEVVEKVPMVCVSPRRQTNMLECVPDTPIGSAANVYPYYCPLCMEYFKDILRSTCCGNYVCLPCATSFVQGKHVEVSTKFDGHLLVVILLQVCGVVDLIIDDGFPTVPCPHCATNGLTLRMVDLAQGERVRDYSTKNNPPVAKQLQSIYSPIKVGDSFEALKRKMVPLMNGTSTQEKEDIVEVVPRTLFGENGSEEDGEEVHVSAHAEWSPHTQAMAYVSHVLHTALLNQHATHVETQ